MIICMIVLHIGEHKVDFGGEAEAESEFENLA